jgi:hypothetical protein
MIRFLVVAVVACSSPAKPVTAPPPPATSGDATCPLEVPGTSVTVEDAPSGVSLVFVTTGAVDQVRARAKTLADAYNGHAAAAGSLAQMIAPSANAATADVDGGSRVTFTAAKPDDAAALQSELRMHAHHLSSGTCKMTM